MIRDFPGGPVAKTPPSQLRGPGSIPGQGTRSHMLQGKLKIPSAATKTWSSQIKFKKKKKLEPVWLEKGSLAEIPQNSYPRTM